MLSIRQMSESVLFSQEGRGRSAKEKEAREAAGGPRPTERLPRAPRVRQAPDEAGTPDRQRRRLKRANFPQRGSSVGTKKARKKAVERPLC